VKTAAVCGMILLAAGGLFAATPEKSAGDEAIKIIVNEVNELASNGIPASVVFAKELAKVLSEHKVQLPDELAKLKAPRQPVPDPNEPELERIYELSNKILDFCRNSVWTKDPEHVVFASLRNDLLVTMVNHCPHSFGRLEAAKWLSERAVPDEERPKTLPDVTPQIANSACLSAINHILSKSPKDKDLYYWSLAFGADLLLKHVTLADMAGQQLKKEAVDKMFTDLFARIDALSEMTTEKDRIRVIDHYKNKCQELEKTIELFFQMFQWKNEVEPVVKAFIEAVNKEDKTLVTKYVLEEFASHITKEESLCSMLCAGSRELKGQNIREVKYLFVITFSDVDNVQQPQFVSASIFLEVITDDGKSHPLKTNLPLTKTPNGWRIGQKKNRI